VVDADVEYRVDVASEPLQGPIEDVVVDVMVVDGFSDSVVVEQIGYVRRAEPSELKRKRKLPKVITSPSMKEAEAVRVVSWCGQKATDPKKTGSS
jgi:hypothetical protein